MKGMRFIAIFALVFTVAGCLPDRLPPLPHEQERPVLQGVVSPEMVDLSGIEDEAELRDSILLSTKGFAVDTLAPIVLSFDDMMDLSTFSGNVLIYSTEGDTVWNLNVTFAGIDTVIDTTTTADSSDTSITIDTAYTYIYSVEHPALEPATEYFVEILGGIKDTSGNSMSIDPDFKLLYEFFTSGYYSTGGIPRAYIADLTAHEVIVVDTLTARTFTTDVERPTGFAVNEEQSKVFVSDKSTSTPYLPVFDRVTGVRIDSIPVGGNQVGLAQVGRKAVTASRSPRKLSMFDIYGDTLIGQVDIGFTPVVVGFNGAIGFVGDALGNVYTYDFDSESWVDTIESVFTRGSRSRHLVSGPGSELYANDYNGNAVKIVLSDGLAGEIQLPENTHPVDVAVGTYIYVAGADGLVLKYDRTTHEMIDSTDLSTTISSIDITPSEGIEELIYLVLPDLQMGDHTGFLGIMSARDLKLIRLVPINATASEVVVEPKIVLPPSR